VSINFWFNGKSNRSYLSWEIIYTSILIRCHMLTRMIKFIAFAVIIVASLGLLSSSNTLMEQTAIAQNMTTNMTDSAGNMTGTGNESGSISGLADI
jgi:hypothetical protein